MKNGLHERFQNRWLKHTCMFISQLLCRVFASVTEKLTIFWSFSNINNNIFVSRYLSKRGLSDQIRMHKTVKIWQFNATICEKKKSNFSLFQPFLEKSLKIWLSTDIFIRPFLSPPAKFSAAQYLYLCNYLHCHTYTVALPHQHPPPLHLAFIS